MYYNEFELKEILIENFELNGKGEYELLYPNGDFETKTYDEIINEIINEIRTIGLDGECEYLEEENLILMLLKDGKECSFELLQS